MTTLRIGVETRSLRQPLRKALETAGRLGADGVQIDLRNELPLADCSRSAVREIRKLLDDYRLRVASVAFPTRRGYDVEADLDRRLAATQRAMDAAAQLGARVVVNHLGEMPEDESSDLHARLIESLTLLARHGDRVGVRLAADTYLQEVGELAGVLGKLPEGTVGVDFNPAKLLTCGHTPLKALERLAPWVIHVTAADAVKERSGVFSRTIDVPLGRGVVDIPELLAALEPHDYRGWVTIQRRESPDPVREIGDAVEYLRNVQRDA